LANSGCMQHDMKAISGCMRDPHSDRQRGPWVFRECGPSKLKSVKTPSQAFRRLLIYRSGDIERHPGPPQVVVEMYGGSFPFVRAAWQRYGQTRRYVCVDILPAAELIANHPDWPLQELLDREEVLFVQWDCSDLTIKEMSVWCGVWGATIPDICALEVSIDCRTWTLAGVCKKKHREANGAAITVEAQEALKALSTLKRIVKQLVHANPSMLIVIENPWHGLLFRHTTIQKLIGDMAFWLLRADLCASYDSTVERKRDGSEFVFPQKTTGLAVAGVDPMVVDMKRCKGTKCRMVLPHDRHKHKALVSYRVAKDPEQYVIDRRVNAVLPLGLMHDIFRAHELWLAGYSGYSKKCGVCGGRPKVLTPCAEASCFRAQCGPCSSIRSRLDGICNNCAMQRDNVEGEERVWDPASPVTPNGREEARTPQGVTGSTMEMGVMWYKIRWVGEESDSWVTSVDGPEALIHDYNKRAGKICEPGSDDEPSSDGDCGESDEEYTVEKVLKKRKYKDTVRYKVLWKGYAKPTWEPESNLIDDNGTVTHALETFWKEHSAGGKRTEEVS
jgi:hypothetical protein